MGCFAFRSITTVQQDGSCSSCVRPVFRCSDQTASNSLPTMFRVDDKRDDSDIGRIMLERLRLKQTDAAEKHIVVF